MKLQILLKFDKNIRYFILRCKYILLSQNIFSSTTILKRMYCCVSMATCSIFILMTQTCWPTIQAEYIVQFPWQQCLNQQHYAQTVTRNINSQAEMLQKLCYIVDSDIYSSTNTENALLCFHGNNGHENMSQC